MTDHRPDDTAPKPERRFSQEQYDMLLRCSEEQDITEWNEWREANPGEEILLEGAGLQEAHLEGASLYRAHFEGADLRLAHLEDANLRSAHLEGADLWEAHLEGVRLLGGHLEGASLLEVHLEDADFTNAAVDGGTLITDCTVDRHTDFTTVPLDAARVDPGLKQLLQYNIRRKRWEGWYEKKTTPKWKAVPVKTFWKLSDYGQSTGRIVGSFFILAGAFAAVYLICGIACRFFDAEGLVANLFETPAGPVPWHLVPLRAAYFSVVTMTTLGFGDMYAAPGSIVGHLLLTVQVLLGYVLLGALITRFAVLFTAGGPSAKFVDERKRDGEDAS
jgi:Ion channel/Pentapeptide repeats (8 copies)